MFSSGNGDDLKMDFEASAIDDVSNQTMIGKLLDEVGLCTFTADPSDMRLCFSSGMSEVIGREASQPMLIEAFAQYFPEEDRERVASEYKKAFEQLVTG